MLLFNFEGACPPRKAKEKTERTLRWGCSSAGRAPALQAGGHGFDSHHLHHASGRKHLFTFHSSLFTEKRKRGSEAVKGTVDESEPHEKRSVAQVVRARA